MQKIYLMDIINKETSLGEKILLHNTSANIIVLVNTTCSLFNKISKEEVVKIRDNYYKFEFHIKIKNFIDKHAINFMNYSNDDIVYIEKYEEYNMITKNLAKQIIGTKYYDDILQKMIKILRDNIYNTWNNQNIDYWYNFYKSLLIYYYVFINCNMNYKLTKKDFAKENIIINMINDLFSIDIL